MEQPNRQRATAAWILALVALFILGAGAHASEKLSPNIAAAIRLGHFEDAAKLLEAAAKSSNADAQYQLASLYRSGRGVPADDAIAATVILCDAINEQIATI